MHVDFISTEENLENVIFVCFGGRGDDELPQIANDEAVVIDLMQHCTGKPHNLVEAEFHHQTDTTF